MDVTFIAYIYHSLFCTSLVSLWKIMFDDSVELLLASLILSDHVRFFKERAVASMYNRNKTNEQGRI